MPFYFAAKGKLDEDQTFLDQVHGTLKAGD